MLARLLEEQFGVAGPAARPTRRMCCGKSCATLIVLVPMEPVEPSKTTFFIR